MAAKKTKLLEQFNEDINRGALKSTLFHGIAILVNGYTKPSSEELKQIMAEHGGLYHIYQSSGLTTHIIASNLPNVKVISSVCKLSNILICNFICFRLNRWAVYQ